MELLTSSDAWISLLTLASLEIVLGIDNIVFISILAGKLPKEQRPKARQVGLALALITRLMLLASLKWTMGLTEPIVTLLRHDFSGRDLILVVGGLFLITKATLEIYDKVEAPMDNVEEARAAKGRRALASVLVQIALLDLVFSLDSVITAIGMADSLVIMSAAVILAVIVMMVFANPIGNFVERHPSIKILALAFLVMIGTMLTAEGTGRHVEKGYIYFAMAFALFIEVLNMRYQKNLAKQGNH